ncbi:eugenol synthase 1-like [Eucalyptus grandis]|uniref:eugenol synthase 1-like n=1 Tax=Eucalyptus grandis TaxID=71139 RepID=UPI00192EBD00|nr:eugenol synthase 1-like [Eucalyptus grandis]
MEITSSSCNKSKILVFGGTGYLGKHVVRASALFGHPTFVFVRPPTPQMPPSSLRLRGEFRSLGVTLVQGELEEHEKMVSVLKQVDIVISVLPVSAYHDQIKIIDAIIAAGNIARFLPSEFGCDEDRITPLPPFEACLEKKKEIRRLVEASTIPYTFVSANCCAAYFINLLLHPHDPRLDIVVYGTGEAKAVLNWEQDVAKYTIKVANDPRTRNRVVIYRPPGNIISQNELISSWEKKTGRKFEKVCVQEDELIKLSQSLPSPDNIAVSILHSVFVKGDLMSFDLDEDDLEASCLYPEIEYTTIDQLLDIFLVDPPEPACAALE